MIVLASPSSNFPRHDPIQCLKDIIDYRKSIIIIHQSSSYRNSGEVDALFQVCLFIKKNKQDTILEKLI
jgi:hypothetical protein